MRRNVLVGLTVLVALLLILVAVRALPLRQSPRTMTLSGVVPLRFGDADRLRIKAAARPFCHPDRSSWQAEWPALTPPSIVAVAVSAGTYVRTLIYECHTGGVHPPLA